MDHPVPDIEVEAPPSVHPLYNLLREMGMAKDHDLKSLPKLPVSEGFKGWGWVFIHSSMIPSIAPAA